MAVGAAARQGADVFGPVNRHHTGARWVAVVVSPLLLALVLVAVRKLHDRTPTAWARLLGALDEQGSGWRRRRFLIVALPYGAALTLAVLASRYLSIRVWWGWRALGVLPLRDPDGSGRPSQFEDFEHLYAAARCPVAVHAGRLACDPFGRTFNQNPVWARLLRPFADHLPLWGLGLVVGLVAVLTCAAIAAMSPRGVVGVVPFMATPAFVLGIERGNHDLLVLPIWALAVLLIVRDDIRAQSLGAVLGISSVALKVFPILGFVPLVALRGRRVAWFGVGVGVGGMAYWLWKHRVLHAMLHATARGALKSYGARSIARVIGGAPPAMGLVVLVWFLTLSVALVVLTVLGPRSGAPRLPPLVLSALAVYVGSFLLIENWSYRIAYSVPVVAALAGPWISARPSRVATIAGVGVFGFALLSPTAWSWAFQIAYAGAAVALLVPIRGQERAH